MKQDIATKQTPGASGNGPGNGNQGPVTPHQPPATRQTARTSATLRGSLDDYDQFCATGWAYDASVEDKLSIDIVTETGEFLARGVANRFRGDLRREGIGDGKCSFVIPLPLSVADGRRHLVVVGALHLVGPDSVIDLLRARGLAVERLP